MDKLTTRRASGRPKKNWVEEIDEGIGREVAWEFFKKARTLIDVSRDLYPEKYEVRKDTKFIDHTIKNRFHTLERRKYLEFPFSREKIKKKLKEGKKIIVHTPHYILSLNILFDFAKEKGIVFNAFEKNTLIFLFHFIKTRNHVYDYFLDKRKKHLENVINGILKYYFSIFIYFGSLYKKYKKKLNPFDKIKGTTSGEIEDLRQKVFLYPSELKEMQEEEKIFNESLKKGLFRSIEEEGLINEQVKTGRNKELFGVYKHKGKTIFTDSFIFYEDFCKQYPKKMEELDRKILQTLGLKVPI